MVVMVSRGRGLPGLTAAGQTNREIAQRLYITQKTVEGHLAPRLPQTAHRLTRPAPRGLSREQGCR